MKNLKKGDKVTLFHINGLAMTSKNEIIFEYITETHIVFKLPKKRKLLQYKIKEIGLAFKEHNLPIKSDMDGNCFRGNACYNLVSKMSKKEVLEYIEANNIANTSDSDKAHMMYLSIEEASDLDNIMTIENCLYPKAEHYSSIIDTIRNTKI